MRRRSLVKLILQYFFFQNSKLAFYFKEYVLTEEQLQMVVNNLTLSQFLFELLFSLMFLLLLLGSKNEQFSHVCYDCCKVHGFPVQRKTYGFYYFLYTVHSQLYAKIYFMIKLNLILRPSSASNILVNKYCLALLPLEGDFQ